MLHLPTERLAALADDEPTAAEAEHLASCLACTRERAAHAALLRLAVAEPVRLAPPLTEWAPIAERLRAEKLVRFPRRTASPATRWLARAAAALVLVAGGMAAGRVSAGETPWPRWGGAVAGGENLEEAPTFDSPEEALHALGRAEVSYQAALQYLAERDASQLPQAPAAMRERLAALDEVASTTLRALNEAPYDPVLNSYYLSTLGAREFTLRQLDEALPQGVRLTSY